MGISHLILFSLLALIILMPILVLIFRKIGYLNYDLPFGIAFLIFGAGYHFLLWDTYMMAQGKLALLIPIGLSFPISILSQMFKFLGFLPYLCFLTMLGTIQFYYIGKIIGTGNAKKNLKQEIIQQLGSDKDEYNKDHWINRKLKLFLLLITDYKSWRRNNIKETLKKLKRFIS